MKPIATVHTPFPDKFGIPRQGEQAIGRIVFKKEYRNPDAIRGIESFSHLWLIWRFHLTEREGFRPMVRPPRLGGNQKVGVFASRAPYRPNPIGLTAVALEGVEYGPQGPVLLVRGVDMVDGTEILDIKPYLPYADSFPEATGGYAPERPSAVLKVEWACDPLADSSLQQSILALVAADPRPHYQEDTERVYGMRYQDVEIKFTVQRDVATVVQVLHPQGEDNRE